MTTTTPDMPHGCSRDTDGWCRIHQWDCADYRLELKAPEEPGYLTSTTEELADKFGIDLDTEEGSA